MYIYTIVKIMAKESSSHLIWGNRYLEIKQDGKQILLDSSNIEETT
jgi:hypothetical protein